MESSASQMHKLGPFNVFDVVYKTVSSTPIYTSILISKSIKPGKHPLLVRFHGGSLIAAARLFLPFLHQWVLDFALSHSAILICPDYRLLPESSGLDILDDVTDFWTWTRETLRQELKKLAPGVEADVERIAVAGESAGGYLGIQSAFLNPEVGIKAVIGQYPYLDVASPFFSQAYEKNLFGFPQAPKDTVDKHIASIKPGTVLATDPEDPPMTRFGLSLAIVQQGRFLEFLGSDPKLLPLENLKASRAELPYLFVFHGKQDSLVPVEGTEAFEKLLKEVKPDAKARFVYVDGEHGFDAASSLETPWLREGLGEVEGPWLGK